MLDREIEAFANFYDFPYKSTPRNRMDRLRWKGSQSRDFSVMYYYEILIPAGGREEFP